MVQCVSHAFRAVGSSVLVAGGSVAPCLTRMCAAYRQPRSALGIFEAVLSLKIVASGSNWRA